MMKCYINVQILVVMMLAFLFTNPSHAQSDEDLIPPEILKEMDQDILTGKRPRRATITQDKIFGLRENPQLDCDVAQLSFDPTKLSTIQRKILKEWIRAGYKPLVMSNNSITKYSEIIGCSSDRAYRSVGDKKVMDRKTYFRTLISDHPVNTDCADVSFGHYIGSSYQKPGIYHDGGTTYYYGYRYLNTFPKNTIVIAGSKTKVVCGLIPYGDGRIYIYNTPAGPDARRWMLNFWHWVLLDVVPGAANTNIVDGSDAEKPDAGEKNNPKHDEILLVNGDSLTGTIFNPTITIRTSYAKLSFELTDIKFIKMESDSENGDRLTLKVGDQLTGVIVLEKVKIKLISGALVEIEKEKIKEIKVKSQ